MSKKKWMLCALVLAVAVAAVGFFYHHTWVDGQLVHKNVEQFQWRSSSLSEPDSLTKLPNLKALNMEAAAMTVEEYESLRSLLPGCAIRWKVPFQGNFYPEDTQSLTITALDASQIEVLKYLPQLKTIDARGCTDYDALLALQSRFPQCAVSYTLALDGQSLPEDITTLEVSSATLEQLQQAMALLPKLTSLKVSGCQDALGLKALQEKYPGCAMVYDIHFGDAVYSSDAAAITLDASQFQQLQQVLPCFTQLADVTLEGDTLALDVHALADAYPGIRFHYSFDLLGVTVHTDQEFVDLSNIAMEDTTALEAKLPYFHNLTKVDMIDCGIKNEEMAALNDRHPGTLFVWTVYLCYKPFRTDITTFYPTGLRLSPTDDNIKNLKYCTELICIDLGHFELSDCSFVEYMPKLQYLILAIGSIEDIRPIGTLKELRFLELFMTQSRDYWPLVNCTKLEDLNLSFSGHGDITPLLQMPWLKKLWICKHYTTPEEEALFNQYLPNTTIIYESDSSTNRGWRNTPYYFEMRDTIDGFYMP